MALSTLPRTHLLSLALFLCAPALASALFASEEEKLEPEEIVRRHVASIGDAALLAGRRSFVATGSCRYRILAGGAADMTGPVQIVSQGRSCNFLVDFQHGSYNGEQFITDGNKVSVAYNVPGTRYPLAEFLFGQKALLREGLWGGVLTTAWPLLEIKDRAPRLKEKGVSKVDDREAWVLQYELPKGGGGLAVRLYFARDDFTHILTTYELQIVSRMGATPDQSPRQRVSRYKLEERFSNFRDFSGLHLPGTWVAQFSQQTDTASAVLQWTFEISQCALNQEIPVEFLQVR